MRPNKLAVLLCVCAFGLLPLQAQVDPEARVEGNVHIPDTSIVRPEDHGLRAHTNHRILITPAGGLGPSGGMTPAQVRSFYGFSADTNLTGGGVIVIIDAYHYATALADFNTFANYFGLPAETSTNATATGNKVFQVVYASGKQPKANAGWGQEAALDIEWAHAMAPAAKIILVEANSASNADLFKAVDVAKGLAGVKQVSMSWSGGETASETSLETHFSAASGPLFFASSGDTGGTVGYPSTSAYVVSVGGTSVTTNSSGAWTAESAWTSGGGGPSTVIAKPTWQTSFISSGKRNTPDISSDADPTTGVCVDDSTAYQGYKGWMVFGGTSVSSPCMAGMVNAAGAAFTNTTAFLTYIYGHASGLRDIITGSNGYKAGSGYDYATGMGTPTGPASF